MSRLTARELYRLGIIYPIAGGQGGLGGESGGEYGHAEGGLEGGFGSGGSRGGGGEGGGGASAVSGETFSNPAPAVQEHATPDYSRADVGSGYATTPGGPGPTGFGGGSIGALGTGGFGPTGHQVAAESAAATEAVQHGATFAELVAPNRTTPTYTNLDVLTYGIQHPVIGRTIARIGQAFPLIGPLLSGALRAFGRNPSFDLSGTGLAGTTGGGEGSPTGAPADPFSGTASSSTTTESGGAPGTGAAPSGGSPLDALAQLLDSLSPPGGGGGGAQPEVAPGEIVGGGGPNYLAWLLLAAAAAGAIYWYYRTHHHRHHAEAHA